MRIKKFSFKFLRNFLWICFLSSPLFSFSQSASGVVKDQKGDPLSGVSVILKSGKSGTTTATDGTFTISVSAATDILIFSFAGYKTSEFKAPPSGNLQVTMEIDNRSLDEVIIVGYGSQKKSDITGAVASLSKDKLEMVPNTNIAQAMQGAIPGVVVQTISAGAGPGQTIMIRGRNSIKANNDPLIVLDGVPYTGDISDINPSDVESIEILKDASSAAIYGSRGANGVVLVNSKTGKNGKTVLSYDGKYGTQKYANLPDLMTGKEFYDFKFQREPNYLTQTEKDIYESGNYTDWMDLSTRIGSSHQHNLSASGNVKDVKFYISGSYLDVKGVEVNDNFKRSTIRLNVDAKISKWLTLGTRTNLTYADQSGASPSSAVFRMNPLSKPYDEDGKLTIYPWPEDIYFPNPLQEILFDNKDLSYQVNTNNYLLVNVPFVPGLSYRLNTGVGLGVRDYANYSPRTTATGFEVQGLANTSRIISSNTVIENILSYSKEIKKHTVFATAVYSFEENKSSGNKLTARGFPHDFLSWYAGAQASVSTPSYTSNRTVLLSQMLRLNYSYDSRYLLTLTGRRDGFSGFGEENKWGFFPSVAVGWNIKNESFFSSKIVDELKLRASFGLNGNQAVGPYETISRLTSYDIISNGASLPGYKPSKLGLDNLGWESSRTINFGIDFSLLRNKISGDINVYKTNTTDLLLDRAISPVQGITSITQNIGQTENRGIELSLNTRNINNKKFKWNTSGNMALMENKIVSLYGLKDENGKELDDVLNTWFIGKPIRVNYGYKMIGVWQSKEADEAAFWGSKPGYVKIQDVQGDKILNANDKQIVGHLDPNFLWGLTNIFTYGNLSFSFFIHGVHGVTKANPLMEDDVYPAVRRNTIVKNWWTPNNPTNDFYMNDKDAAKMAGIDFEGDDQYYENASFIRLKDVTLSYSFPKNFIGKAGFDRVRLYLAGRNLYTITKWRGLDPELDEQRAIPLQKELVIGLNLSF